eukprot:3237774-Prymnesium_polylepis.2
MQRARRRWGRGVGLRLPFCDGAGGVLRVWLGFGFEYVGVGSKGCCSGSAKFERRAAWARGPRSGFGLRQT